MSRVGRLPVPIPKGVSVDIGDKLVTVKGPKGELQEGFRPEVSVSVDGESVVVERTSESRKARGFHGLYRQLIRNMIVGFRTGILGRC